MSRSHPDRWQQWRTRISGEFRQYVRKLRGCADYAYLGQGIGVTRTHRGHRIFVYTRDLALAPHIVMAGIWEWAVEQAVLKLVASGDTVVEVGCNMGYHSLAICERLGRDGRFFGFEANPELFRLLRWSIDHNDFGGRASLFNHAVTQTQGEVQFTFDPQAVGGGHVLTELRTEPEVITVPGIPLDETLIELGGVSLLRMDVEGFEPMVIRGARRLIERSPDIAIVAEWSVPMMSIRVDLASFVEELEKAGFRAWRINGDARFVPVAMADLLTLPHCEVAFARIDLERFN
jgi:FkbM family methyltransferase